MTMHADLWLPRLGMTLIHSLWELSALGLLLGCVLSLLRNATPSTRFALAFTGLFLMLAAVGTTWVVLAPREPVQGILQGLPLSGVAAPSPGTSWRMLDPVRAQAWVGSAWDPLCTWLARIWLLGLTFMGLRLVLAWEEARRQFAANPVPVDPRWQEVVDRLGERIGLRSPVRLRCSTRLDSPMVWGWMRPVLMIPLSAFLHLTPEALEAVIAHELAHVRRLDHWTGLAQAIAESILFYHPAVWWLSRQIRELREHCCDDEAVRLCGDPLVFAEGLALLEQLRRAGPLLAMAHASQRGPLMNRLSRMLQPERPRPLVFRGLLVPLVLGLCATALLAAHPLQKALAPAFDARLPVTISYWGQELRVEGQPGQTLEPASSDAFANLVAWGVAQLEARLAALQGGSGGPGVQFRTLDQPSTAGKGPQLVISLMDLPARGAAQGSPRKEKVFGIASPAQGVGCASRPAAIWKSIAATPSSAEEAQLIRDVLASLRPERDRLLQAFRPAAK